jgi:hypothetical protein
MSRESSIMKGVGTRTRKIAYDHGTSERAQGRMHSVRGQQEELLPADPGESFKTMLFVGILWLANGR